MLVTQYCTYTGDYLDRPEDAGVLFSCKLVRALSKLSQDVPEVIPVMLAMAKGLGENGAIKLPQAEVAFECNITIQQVRKVVVELSRYGLIANTEMSTEPNGVISCWVNEDSYLSYNA